MSLSGLFSGRVIGLILVGALAVVIPSLLSSFLPASLTGSTMMLGIVTLVLGVVLKGKVKIVGDALIVGAGGLLLSPIFSSLTSGIARSSNASSGEILI